MIAHKAGEGAEKGVQAVWLKVGWNHKIRAWRESVGWSASYLARELGVSRSYVKHLESSKKPWLIRPRIAKRLSELMATITPKVRLEIPRQVVIVTRHALPAKVFLYVRPRKCRGHNRASVMAANQVYCGASVRQRGECRRAWKRRERKKLKED